MTISKEERDQWRDRLSSPYTCFEAAHADFTIRLLDALEEAEADKRRLELEANWLANAADQGGCSSSIVCARCPLGDSKLSRCYGKDIREAARRAVEEERPQC